MMMWRMVTSLAFISVVVAVLPAGVSAHAGLDRSLPEPDSIVEQAPDQVEIWFTEELAEGTAAMVTGPGGDRVDNDDVAIDLFDPERKHLVVTLMPDLPAGEYTVTWTSVSGEDDDAESGSFTFTISGSATPVASPAGSPIASPSPAASPESTGEAAVVSQTSTETATPDTRTLLIALAAGAIAAALIYGFWLIVKPKTEP